MDWNSVLPLLPLIAPVATPIVVILGVFFSNHHVDFRIADVSKLITAESARLEAVLKFEIASVSNRVKALEDRAGLIYRQ
jgi:hypothetical protein